MNTNEEIKKFHRALVKEATVKCVLEGNRRFAVEIGNEIVAYGKRWADAFADDGRVDAEEMGRICTEFDALVDRRIPAKTLSAANPLAWILKFAVGKLQKLIGIAWCLALSLALAGCLGNKASHQNGVVAYVSTSGQLGIGYGECEDLPGGCRFERDVTTTTVTAGNFIIPASTNLTHAVTRWDTTGMSRADAAGKDGE